MLEIGPYQNYVIPRLTVSPSESAQFRRRQRCQEHLIRNTLGPAGETDLHSAQGFCRQSVGWIHSVAKLQHYASSRRRSRRSCHDAFRFWWRDRHQWWCL